MAEVSHESGSEIDVDSGGLRQTARHFGGGVSESGSEPIGAQCRSGRKLALAAQRVEMVHGELQDVRLFQLGDVFAFGLQSGDHQLLEFVQAAVDASAPLALEHRLHDFAVLVRPGDGTTVFRDERRVLLGVSDLVRHRGLTSVSVRGERASSVCAPRRVPERNEVRAQSGGLI